MIWVGYGRCPSCDQLTEVVSQERRDCRAHPYDVRPVPVAYHCKACEAGFDQKSSEW